MPPDDVVVVVVAVRLIHVLMEGIIGTGTTEVQKIFKLGTNKINLSNWRCARNQRKNDYLLLVRKYEHNHKKKFSAVKIHMKLDYITCKLQLISLLIVACVYYCYLFYS